MTRPTAIEVVREFWRLMATNDLDSVAAVLAPDFVPEWPLSGERIRGAERFAQMNIEYPSHGPWFFTIHRLVGAESEAVSDVTVTDGMQTARAISFFTVAGGKINPPGGVLARALRSAGPSCASRGAHEEFQGGIVMNAAIAPLAEPHFEELRAVLMGATPRHIEGTHDKR